MPRGSTGGQTRGPRLSPAREHQPLRSPPLIGVPRGCTSQGPPQACLTLAQAAPGRVHRVELLPALPQVGAAVVVVAATAIVVLEEPAPSRCAVLVHSTGRAVSSRLRARRGRTSNLSALQSPCGIGCSVARAARQRSKARVAATRSGCRQARINQGCAQQGWWPRWSWAAASPAAPPAAAAAPPAAAPPAAVAAAPSAVAATPPVPKSVFTDVQLESTACSCQSY